MKSYTTDPSFLSWDGACFEIFCLDLQRSRVPSCKLRFYDRDPRIAGTFSGFRFRLALLKAAKLVAIGHQLSAAYFFLHFNNFVIYSRYKTERGLSDNICIFIDSLGRV